MDEFDWAAAVGHVRVLENSLLASPDLSRLADAAGVREIVSALRDTAYGRYVEGASSLEEAARALEGSLADQYRYVLSLSPDPGLLLGFLSKYDFHNLKVLARELLLGMPAEPEAVSSLSVVPFGHVRDAVLKGRNEEPLLEANALEGVGVRYCGPGHAAEARDFVRQHLVPGLVCAFHRARTIVSEGGGSFEVDSVIDRKRASWQARFYDRGGYEPLKRVASAETDITNLRMSLRSYYHGIREALLGEILLPGGTISVADIAASYARSPRDLERVFSGTPWAELASKGVARVERRESLAEWEKECDDTLVDVYRAGRTRPLGPEPVVGFLYAKETEVKNLRIVFSGKRYGATREWIVSGLRKSYV